MDTNAKNKHQNEEAEDELIRHLLLQAEAEEYREVLSKAPPAPRHSWAYRRWEKRFLLAPFSVLEETGGLHRVSFPKFLQAAASILLVIVCAFVLMLGMNPEARAAVAEKLGFVSQMETPGINLTIQLSGRGGSVYTSERFRCDKSNGDDFYYAFENHGEEECTLRLYQVGIFQTKSVGEVVTIQPGERDFGIYKGLKGNAYFLRVTSVMGGKINGTLQTSQGYLGESQHLYFGIR